MNTILSIISVLLICWSVGLTFYLIWMYKSYYSYKENITKEISENLDTLNNIEKDIEQKQQIINTNNDFIIELNKAKENIQKEIDEQHSFLNILTKQQKESVDRELSLYQQLTDTASKQYFDTLENNYQEKEKQYDKKIQEIYEEYKQAENSLQSIRSSLMAGMKANLAEQEKQKQLEFYKIKLSNSDIEDILTLNKLKETFHQPTALSKIIWSVYYQKKITDLCNKICGEKTVCGIYKITNTETSQVYIGQSVDIASRFKQHCKCGCGIDAPQSNKLYQSMLEYGLWNFTFEIVEDCPRDQLNEKERFWINFYQSDFYGLNSNKGISK